MASVCFRRSQNVILSCLKGFSQPLRVAVRHRVTSETGAILPEPKKMQFGLVRVLFTVLPGLYLGATISKEGAAFLEENDIFVPDEDDDED